MDWSQILVIILGITLAIFLVLAVILVALLIKVTQQIRAVTSSAQRTVERFEETAANASRATSPLLVARTIARFMKKRKSGGKK